MNLKHIILAGLPVLIPITIEASEAKSQDITLTKEQHKKYKAVETKLVALLEKSIIPKHIKEKTGFTVKPQHKLEEDLGIDSLGRMVLAARIQKEFDLIRFRIPYISRFTKEVTSNKSKQPRKTTPPCDNVQCIIDQIVKMSYPTNFVKKIITPIKK